MKCQIHDEKNHLSAIKSLANNRDVDDYIDQLLGQICTDSSLGSTKNKQLDLIINKYRYICQNENIEFYTSIRTANLVSMPAPDLIALFSNLLDNAVEAAKNSAEKRIDLSLNKANGFDILTLVNSCDKKPQTVDGTLQTTKTESGYHGIGIRSIKKTVQKYSGAFDWEYNEEKKEFTVCGEFKF